MTNPNDKIIDRIRKLLELSHSDNEHEAAQAAARAAQMMSENAVTEAMLQVVADDDVQYVPERIINSDGPTYDAFKERTKGFRSTRTMGNSTRRRGGYSAGREAGKSISLGGSGKALKS